MDRPRTIPEACAEIRIGRSTLYRLWHEGKIKFVKIGGGSFVMESEIERFLATIKKRAA